MDYALFLAIGLSAFSVGTILGYYSRQLIAKKDWKTIEAKLQKKIEKATERAESLLSESKIEGCF